MNKQHPKQPTLTAAVQAALAIGPAIQGHEAVESKGERTLKPTKKLSRNKTMAAAPLIFTDKAIAMQSLADAVGNGYTRYVTGSTPIEKVEKTLAIFGLNYGAFADRNERARRKRKGLGNVMAVFFWRKDDRIMWWLLSTPSEMGSHPIHSSERLKNALLPQERIEIDGFELVRVPKPGTSESKLTWRMEEQKYQDFRDYVIDTVRSRSHNRMDNMLYQLWSMPGFSGIRRQIGKLAALYRGEVKRAGVKDAPKPPRRLRYLRRIPHEGLTAREILNEARNRQG